VKVGRKSEQPAPSIFFGAFSVKAGHAEFSMTENGHIQLEVTNPLALEQTLINGKCLTAEEPA